MATEAIGMSFNQVMQLVAALSGVIVLIFVLAWAMKKVKNVPFSKGENIKVISSTYLNSRANITTIEIDGVCLVLGVGAQGVNHLYTFPASSKIKDTS